MSGALGRLFDAGALSALDVHFAATVGRLGGEHDDAVLLAAALTSARVGAGHVCLDLEALVRAPEIVAASGEAVGLVLPALKAWQEALRRSPLVSAGERATPLVLDGGGRLYLGRYWEHQERVAAAIERQAGLAPAGDVSGGAEEDALRADLARFFPGGAGGCVDWQRIAALVAMRRRFCVVSGGPGTGKTFTVAKILALGVERARRAGIAAPRVLLLAPTGKAAARLSESIVNAKRDLPCDPEVKAAIPAAASTIHRCLRPIGGSATRFRFHSARRLDADVVLVDEASMVDLALLRRLVDALPDEASLILLGDKDQLASVESGAVLGDICNLGAERAYSAEFAQTVAEWTGAKIPVAAAGGAAIADCIVELRHSYRYGPDSGIGALARAINRGEAGAALEVLASPAHADVARVEPGSGGEPSAALRAEIDSGFEPYLRAGGAMQRLEALDRFRVLCAHRSGPFGVEAMNAHIESWLRPRLAGGGARESDWYEGRPILVIQNDYRLNLFNGDVAVVGRSPELGLAAYFRDAAGAERRLSLSRLPPHETVFAMTVHKSQGSEFDAVAVVLPDEPSAVTTRELLYTAVTRARRRVSVHGDAGLIAAAVERRIERASGLRDRLWGERRSGG